ncbi:MAG: UDP-glucose/GDP-mannose dehydrogenase family protein [Thermodesulfobacteriota bacterium]
MNISVVGTGYVGLVTGACLAGSGNNVICVDIDKVKINRLKEGKVTFYEPGLEDIVRKNIKEERLHFTTDLDYAVKSSTVVLIAVGTPPNGDGSADTSAVINAAQSIGKSLDDYKVIVTKSTIPVGTTEMIRDEINKVTDIKFDVASNPEFLKEGAAVEDFMKPDRILIGADNESTAQILKELYAPFMRSMDRAVVVSIRSSELAKYAANAMLATRISFMNDIANLCELVGANISEVRLAIGSDDRIGCHFLFPGIGYGGSCFPKDVKALINTASNFGYELQVCRATDEVNTKQKELFWQKIENYFEGGLQGKKFSIWGVSFKPKTDDIREAPSLYIIEKLISNRAFVTVHDPVALDNAKARYGNTLHYADSNYEACEGADALIINTEWNEYRQPDFGKIKELMNGKVIFDGRNLYKPEILKDLGLKYFGVGIGN